MTRPTQAPALGDQVRLRRLERGLTQEDLSRLAGVTISTIRNIERGRTGNSYRLRDVYRALGWPETGPVSADDERELAQLRERFRTTGLSDDELDVAARAVQADRREPQAKRRNLPPPPSRGHSRVVSEGGGHERDGDGDLA